MGKLTTQYFEQGSARIAYREYGSGPALILLHGNSGSKAFFSKYQTDHFNMFRTIAIDSRGHGETDCGESDFSICQCSEDVIALCQWKGISQAFVIGYSDGGNIALFLALKAPHLFPKIVAISPNYLVSGTTDGTLRFIQAYDRFLRALERLGLPARKSIRRNELMLKDIGITAEQLGSISTSLRILYAENDMIKEDHILDMGSRIPGAAVCKIEGCNHMTILYKREAIEDIKANFLSPHPAVEPLFSGS